MPRVVEHYLKKIELRGARKKKRGKKGINKRYRVNHRGAGVRVIRATDFVI